MNERILIINGRVVLPDRIVPRGQVALDKGRIDQINRHNECRSVETKHTIDAGGGYILPGFIDIHSDAIEKEIEPRPGAFFDPGLAFRELEKKLAGQGITTMFHSFSFAGAEWGLREDENAAGIIRQIMDAAGCRSIIRNKIHARFEVTDYSGVEIVKELLNEKMVDILSFMDHTPGQGQYPTVDDYRRYMEKTYHLPPARIEQMLEEKEKGRTRCLETIEVLSRTALAHRIPLASHDDDSADKVAYYREHGVTINEFPVNLAAAKEACRLGNDVCVGAPNIVRNGSSGKAMRAMDAIIAGNANMLCSDYYPPSILHAVFEIARETGSLSEAVNLASLIPARATGLTGLGSLEEGKLGDVVIVNMDRGLPVITHTIVEGVPVYGMKFRPSPA